MAAVAVTEKVKLPVWYIMDRRLKKVTFIETPSEDIPMPNGSVRVGKKGTEHTFLWGIYEAKSESAVKFLESHEAFIRDPGGSARPERAFRRASDSDEKVIAELQAKGFDRQHWHTRIGMIRDALTKASGIGD